MGKAYRTAQRKVNGKVREVRDNKVVMELDVNMAGLIESLPRMVEELALNAGLLAINAIINAECEEKAGKKHARNPHRTANWWGNEDGVVRHDGQMVPFERPRLRGKNGKEVVLETYREFQNPTDMNRMVAKRFLLGLSSRNYEESVRQLIKGYGLTKSSVSRKVAKATAEQMRQLMERDLSGLEFCVIFIDGTNYKEHLLVVAIGVDTEGRKHVLGLREGATENRELCMGLLEDMARRGLDTSGDYLFILDGSKGLRSAVTRMFGADTNVQRCQVHKIRNVCGHLPKKHQSEITRRIKAAYKMSRYDDAKESLDITVSWLERLNPSAAESLKEGMEETLTVHRLGITGYIRKTLSSTNVIESCFSITSTITGRVKRWQGNDMVQRWAATSLLRAESKFKRVKGYRDIPKVIAALKQHKNLDLQKQAA